MKVDKCVYYWKPSSGLLVLLPQMATIKIIFIRPRQGQLAFDDVHAAVQKPEMQVDKQDTPIHQLVELATPVELLLQKPAITKNIQLKDTVLKEQTTSLNIQLIYTKLFLLYLPQL